MHFRLPLPVLAGAALLAVLMLILGIGDGIGPALGVGVGALVGGCLGWKREASRPTWPPRPG
ncbi:MAG TPA: hypothetical protein VD970_08665 [Acetobacteraceae bacterium]|nr:hypothetical protein [Acetobacteraceae bacterium]